MKYMAITTDLSTRESALNDPAKYKVLCQKSLLELVSSILKACDYVAWKLKPFAHRSVLPKPSVSVHQIRLHTNAARNLIPTWCIMLEELELNNSRIWEAYHDAEL